jgi:DNA-binding NtrC family response regulator
MSLGSTVPVDSDATEVRRFRLVITIGPDTGKTFAASGERTVIGTHETAALALTDPTVSRFHVEIALTAGQAILRDLGSRNGTRVDGVPVLAAPLLTNATLSLGNSQVRFELDTAVVRLPASDRDRFGVMVGGSLVMRRMFATLERAAHSDATVLIEGETGTGKEAAAESIHAAGARADGPFVVVDCGAIPANLLESELFGHERGAFTGAVDARKGAFEEAEGGTLFLDEIGELAPELQPKLLRALERREVKRVGAARHRRVDVRIVAATHRDLRAEVNARTFRSDLFYRLAVLDVRVPPLRERREDIPLLVEHFLTTLAAADEEAAALLRSAGFQDELRHHSWPGNVRELRNYLERCLALHEHAPLVSEPAAETDAPIDLSRPLREVREAAARRVEHRYVVEVLRRHDGNVTAAARAAGVDRIHFYRILARQGLRSR